MEVAGADARCFARRRLRPRPARAQLRHHPRRLARRADLGAWSGSASSSAWRFSRAPTTSLVASFFLDEIAELVEREIDPMGPPGKPAPALEALMFSLRFALLSAIVTVIALILLFVPGFGFVAWIAANAYLLGNEYFRARGDALSSPGGGARDAPSLRRAGVPCRPRHLRSLLQSRSSTCSRRCLQRRSWRGCTGEFRGREVDCSGATQAKAEGEPILSRRCPGLLMSPLRQEAELWVEPFDDSGYHLRPISASNTRPIGVLWPAPCRDDLELCRRRNCRLLVSAASGLSRSAWRAAFGLARPLRPMKLRLRGSEAGHSS